MSQKEENLGDKTPSVSAATSLPSTSSGGATSTSVKEEGATAALGKYPVVILDELSGSDTSADSSDSDCKVNFNPNMLRN